jgi:hypothetical protein
MKRIVMMFLAIFMMFMGSTVFAQQSNNIGGVWRETSTNEIVNSIVVVSQDGNNLTLCAYWEFRGNQFVWQATGTINGRKVVYQLKHTKYLAGWGVEGVHELELAGDGRSMIGQWKNNKGESGSLKFVKVH